MNTNKSQTEQLPQDAVSGSILIYNHKYTSVRIEAKSNIKFFDTPVVFEFTDEYVKITKPELDYSGKTIKMNKQNSGWYGTTINKDLPRGKFLFDKEDSNEDELIAYYR